jgi:hypothetical protein
MLDRCQPALLRISYVASDTLTVTGSREANYTPNDSQPVGRIQNRIKTQKALIYSAFYTM